MAFFHVWFSPKRRKWLLQGDVDGALVAILREVACSHSLDLRVVGPAVDHVHLLISVRDRLDLSRAMHLLKGTSSRLLHQRFPELALDIGETSLWQRGYGVKHVEDSAVPRVTGYIRTQGERLGHLDRS